MSREAPWLGFDRPLRPRVRVLVVGLAWVLFVASGPGALSYHGTPALAVFAVALWGAAAARPGPYAFLIEWLVASAGIAAQLEWIRHVSWPALVPTGLGMGLYTALAGPLLRRLAVRRLAFPLAVAAAWTSVETLRALYPPPIGHGWLRLGHVAGAWPALLDGARVVSVVGASFALAALGGLAAELARLQLARARGEFDEEPGARLYARLFAAGALPLAVVAALGVLVPAPPSTPGPRLLLIQPNVSQARKMAPPSPRELFDDQVALTRATLAALEASGERAPDLVCWAETMLPIDVLDASAREGILAGVPLAPWSARVEPRQLLEWDQVERQLVHRELLGRDGARGVLPPGTAFLSGVEAWTERDGELRRLNAVALWPADPDAERQLAAKRFLVPGAEGLMGLERHGWVRRWIRPVAGYVPDFVPAERTGVLELARPDGGAWRIGATVCFDNAFLEAYLEPVQRGDLDFHLVASNEAWYLEAWELDQMVAFSKLAAAATGRALVRVTNSGVTCWVTPAGRVAERLVVAGRDRLVRGALVVDVPVPVRDGAGDAPKPPAVVLAPVWRYLFLALGPALLLLRRRAQPAR